MPNALCIITTIDELELSIGIHKACILFFFTNFKPRFIEYMKTKLLYWKRIQDFFGEKARLSWIEQIQTRSGVAVPSACRFAIDRSNLFFFLRFIYPSSLDRPFCHQLGVFFFYPFHFFFLLLFFFLLGILIFWKVVTHVRISWWESII